MKEEADKTPSIYDKDWQKKDELGTVEKTFRYIGLDGKKGDVTAKATIHPGQQFELLTEQNTKKGKNGLDTLDTKKHTRSIVKLVFGIDGTGLQNILDHKGSDLYNQIRNFAFEISGLSMTEDEVEDEKN